MSFSEIKSIQATNNSVVLFPTISNGSEISIKNSDGGDEELNVDIYNSGGQKIFSRRISHDVQNLIEGEQVLVAGKYFAVVDGIGVHPSCLFLLSVKYPAIKWDASYILWCGRTNIDK
ncbi:MAG: hypothetical protein IPP51_11715 [Bacteroidetes bacterium]|nr:hypothetical protein [Bacteroidota bacterium]